MVKICFYPREESTTQLEDSSANRLEDFVTDSSTPQIEGIVTESSTPQIEEIITEDGILCLILSSLTLKEAVRTSILSSRWRHIWTHLTKFNFDAITLFDGHTLQVHQIGGIEALNQTKGRTAEFIQSVDSVLRHLQGARLYEFEVAHFFDRSHSCHLDEWVRFAVASKAKIFRLHLFRSHVILEPYEFPCQLVGSSPFIERLTIMFCTLKLPYRFDGFSHLKRLGLGDVEINQEDFNCILTNCSSTLVKLSLWLVPLLVSVSIPHPLSQLEFLFVQSCDQLRKIEIDAMNLITLCYHGVPVDFRLRNSPKLIDANICFKTEGTVHNLDFYLTKLTSGLPHLRSLTFKISGVSKMTDLPKGSSRFVHLTCLDFEWDVGVEMNLLHLTSLMNAAPLLEELKLCLSTHVEELPQAPSKLNEMVPKHAHTHLKIIEVSGFYFETWQIVIAVYLLNNATKLKSMTIHRVSKPPRFVPEEIVETGMKNLRQQVRADTNLVIL